MSSGIKLEWKAHFSLLQDFHQQSLNESTEKKLYEDATVVCDRKFYPVHRLLLSASSSYFSDIFNRVHDTAKHPVIVLKDISSSVFELILRFIYLGEINVHENQLNLFLNAANSLEIIGINDCCVENTNRPQTFNNNQPTSQNQTGTVSVKTEPPDDTSSYDTPEAFNLSSLLVSHASCDDANRSLDDDNLQAESFLFPVISSYKSLAEMNNLNSTSVTGLVPDDLQVSATKGTSEHAVLKSCSVPLVRLSNTNKSPEKPKITNLAVKSEPTDAHESDDGVLMSFNNFKFSKKSKYKYINPTKATIDKLPDNFIDISYQCIFCLERFSNKNSFKDHLKQKHMQFFKYQCPDCYYASVQSDHTCIHYMSVHMKMPPFPCLTCDRFFKLNPNNLSSGHACPNMKKVMACSKCSFFTTLASEFKMHSLIFHPIGNGPYACKKCSKKKMKTYDSYVRHMISHSQTDEYLFCPYCNLLLKNMLLLKMHLINHHKYGKGKYYVNCNKCQRSFDSKCNYALHISSKDDCKEAPRGERYSRRFTFPHSPALTDISPVIKKVKRRTSSVNSESQFNESVVKRIKLELGDNADASIEQNTQLGTDSNHNEPCSSNTNSLETNTSQYFCSECNFSTNDSTELSIHINNVHASFQVSSNNETMPTDEHSQSLKGNSSTKPRKIVKQISSKVKSRVIYCPYCHLLLPHLLMLSDHIQELHVNEVEPLQCDCNRNFTSLSSYINHLRFIHGYKIK